MSECILWDGPVHSKGYGIAGRQRVHRVVWQEFNEQPVPRGMVVHHTCGTKLCVNPEHLALMAPGDHLRLHDPARNDERRAQTHCHRGHPLSGDNLRIYGGLRHCKACATIRMREFRAKGVK